jgi:hypothetical protein
MNVKTELGEVLFEITRLRDIARVSAVHVASNTEVSLVGPANAPQAALLRAATQKLRYVLAKAGEKAPP